MEATYKIKDFDFSKWKAFFAFEEKQLNEARERLWISKDEKLVSLGMWLIALKSNYKEMIEAMNKHYKEEAERRKKLQTKEEIIEYELRNYEAYYTWNISDTVEVVKEYWFTEQDVLKVYNLTKDKYD